MIANGFVQNLYGVWTFSKRCKWFFKYSYEIYLLEMIMTIILRLHHWYPTKRRKLMDPGAVLLELSTSYAMTIASHLWSLLSLFGGSFVSHFVRVFIFYFLVFEGTRNFFFFQSSENFGFPPLKGGFTLIVYAVIKKHT